MPIMETLRTARGLIWRALSCQLPRGWSDGRLMRRSGVVVVLWVRCTSNTPISCIFASTLQGQGLGPRRMRAALRATEAPGLLIYLECAGERLTQLYGRFVFEFVGEAPLELGKGLGADWPPQKYYAMVRPAAISSLGDDGHDK